MERQIELEIEGSTAYEVRITLEGKRTSESGEGSPIKGRDVNALTLTW